jgi:hypothetical protein
MAVTDEKDTKAMLDRQLEPLQNKLEAGNATPEQVQQALGIAIAHIRIFVKRETVTQDEFEKAVADAAKKLADHAANCPGVKIFTKTGETLKEQFMQQGFGMLGWVLLVGLLAWKAYAK